MKKIIPMLAIFLILCINTAIAEPSAISRILISEPMSMMDWGLYKMTKRMEKLTFSSEQMMNPEFEIIYDVERDRIKIYSYLTMFNSTLVSNKKLCRNVVNIIRNELGVNDGKLGDYTLSFFFQHSGRYSEFVPLSAASNIANIVEIVVEVSQHLDLTQNKKVLCEAPLVGTKVLFSEKQSP